jgi:hypothetical protein
MRTYITEYPQKVPITALFLKRKWRWEKCLLSLDKVVINQVISRRFCKRQQMQWTKRGAHLLLQTRVKTLNQELRAVFQRWYPDLKLEEEPLAA